MAIRKDLMGVEPKMDDLVAYNPPYQKGVEIGIVVAFSTSGLPIVIRKGNKLAFDIAVEEGNLPPSKYLGWHGCSTPRTGFVVIKQEENGTN